MFRKKMDLLVKTESKGIPAAMNYLFVLTHFVTIYLCQGLEFLCNNLPAHILECQFNIAPKFPKNYHKQLY